MDADKRFLDLEEKERQLLASNEVKALSEAMKEAEKSYEEATRYHPADSLEAKQAQIKLHEAKRNLDYHPLCLAYQQARSKVNETMAVIEEILFGEIRRKPKLGGNHD